MNRRPWMIASAAVLVSAALVSAAWSATSPPLVAAERKLMLEALAASEAARLAQADDGAVEAAVVARARAELGLRLRPSSVDPLWALAPAPRDVAQELASARASGQLAQWLEALPQPSARYRRLLAARRGYAAIVNSGGWPVVPGGTIRRPGDKAPEIAILRTRLAMEGYGQAGSAADSRFDAALSGSLAAFQRHHGLPPDGVLGSRTRAALNVTAPSRLAQIDANLERWRWVPHQLPADRMVIDVAGARGILFENGRPTLRMRVIVGDPRHRTPMFSSRITAVVLNPPWVPPDSIADTEIRPKAILDPGYLARNRFVEQGGRLTQLPGPGNALGQVKFDLPSPFGVYLHDTPGKSAFSRSTRTLSHGCVRLEKPRELAAKLLGAQGWTSDVVNRAIATGVTRRVDLRKATPLYVFYWTAVATDSGVDFRADPYGWDRALTDALASSRRLE